MAHTMIIPTPPRRKRTFKDKRVLSTAKEDMIPPCLCRTAEYRERMAERERKMAEDNRQRCRRKAQFVLDHFNETNKRRKRTPRTRRVWEISKEEMILEYCKTAEYRERMAERDRKMAEDNRQRCRRKAQFVLNHFNETNKETEYELVSEHPNITTINHRGKKRFDHMNFVAKPKGVEGEKKLFFGEIEVTNNPENYYHVTMCCILGPEGVVTGSQRCTTCSNGRKAAEDKCLQDPVGGGFKRGTLRPRFLGI